MLRVQEDGGSELQHLAERAEAAFFDAVREAKEVRQQLLLREMDGYYAYALDLDYLWRWEIYEGDDKLVQSGCSISLNSAREAVDHVFAYYNTVGLKAGPDSGARGAGRASEEGR